MSQAPCIAPSILSADFGRLAEEVAAVTQAGAGWIHVDVMDGRFVPNLTLGPVVVQAVRRATHLPLDVHLMVEQPQTMLEAFARAGADQLTVHVEACTHLQRTLAQIRALGVKAGVALNPHTPPVWLDYILEDLDLVLVMTVNPGFGGQSFLPGMLAKIRDVAARVQRRASKNRVDIVVDGGIHPANAAEVTEAGATVLVAGQAVFSKPSYRDAILALQEEARRFWSEAR